MRHALHTIILAAALSASVAHAAETTNQDPVASFVETAYPKITTLSGEKGRDSISANANLFSSEDAFNSYYGAMAENGMLDFIFIQGGEQQDDVIGKVRTYDKKGGSWKVEFIGRHKTLGPDVETAECQSVTVMLKQRPSDDGKTGYGIVSVETRPSKVTCPQD